MAGGLEPTGILLCSSILLVQGNLLLGSSPTAISPFCFLSLGYRSFCAVGISFLLLWTDLMFGGLRPHTGLEVTFQGSRAKYTAYIIAFDISS
jgi:hypothetical protein